MPIPRREPKARVGAVGVMDEDRIEFRIIGCQLETWIPRLVRNCRMPGAGRYLASECQQTYRLKRNADSIFDSLVSGGAKWQQHRATGYRLGKCASHIRAFRYGSDSSSRPSEYYLSSGGQLLIV